MTYTPRHDKALAADARNRALRTLLQGLAFSVLAALAVALFEALTSSTSWSEFWGKVIAFSFFQSIAVAALSWLMRTYLDKSRLRTPLPPADPGEPDVDEPEALVDQEQADRMV